VGYVYSQCDFNSFDRIQEKKAKLSIKNIQMGNLLKGRTGAKVILNDDLLFASERMKNRLAGQPMPKNVALTKGIPSATFSDEPASPVQRGRSGAQRPTLNHSPKSQHRISSGAWTSARHVGEEDEMN
jgi:hypothetical protein